MFGASSNVFNTLTAAYSPIVAAGPNQPGYSLPEKQALDSQAIDATGAAYSSARQAIGEQEASIGGGNVALPSGASIGPQLALSSATAKAESSELNSINIADYAQGNQNWLNAAQGLAGAPNVFGVAGNFGSNAISGGKTAFGEADTINQENIAAQNAELATIGGVVSGVGSLIPGVGPVLGALGNGLQAGAQSMDGGNSDGSNGIGDAGQNSGSEFF